MQEAQSSIQAGKKCIEIDEIYWYFLFKCTLNLSNLCTV